jgi:DNA primase
LLSNKVALRIVKSTTKLNDDSIERYEIGYAPPQGLLLQSDELSEQDKKDLEEIGLIKTGEDGKKYEFFRNRIIFPIMMNMQYETIVKGFTGRDVTGAARAKYLHSQSNDFYSRNTSLGCYDEEGSTYCITEGMKDAIKLNQLGVKGAVAVLGSSLSDRQVALMMHAKNIFIMMDNDNAGKEATTKIIKKLLESGFTGGIQAINIIEENDASDLVDSCKSVHDIGGKTIKIPMEQWIISIMNEETKSIKGSIEKASAMQFQINEFIKGFANQAAKDSVLNSFNAMRDQSYYENSCSYSNDNRVQA